MIEITEINDEAFQFCLKTENNQILLTSVKVNSVEKIEKMIYELNKSGGNRLRFERKTNHKGKFFFNIKNKGGQLLATSECYSSEAGMENGIKNLKFRLATL